MSAREPDKVLSLTFLNKSLAPRALSGCPRFADRTLWTVQTIQYYRATCCRPNLVKFGSQTSLLRRQRNNLSKLDYPEYLRNPRTNSPESLLVSGIPLSLVSLKKRRVSFANRSSRGRRRPYAYRWVQPYKSQPEPDDPSGSNRS